MIYSCYSGTGKTTLCKKIDGFDLDSSAYSKEPNWAKKYCEDAKRLSADGKKVFISAHKEVIKYLIKHKIEFVLCIPDGSHAEWLSRLVFRYCQTPTDGNRNAVIDCVKNFDSDMAFYKTLNCPIIKVKAKSIQTDLEEKVLKLMC